MGLFDSIIGGVTSFFDNSSDTSATVSDALSGIGSELGGSLLDQLTGMGGDPSSINPNFGGNVTDLFGGIFGPGAMPTNPLLPSGVVDLFGGLNFGSDPASVQAQHPLDTSIPLTLGGGGSMSDMSALGTFGPFMRARRPGVPWKRITRMVRTAVRYFGPSVAMAIVQQLAALLAGNGVTDASGQAITGGEILYRSLQQGGGGSRRSRGITGRQLSITGKTIRKLNSMHAKIAQIAGRGNHRSSPRPQYAFQRRRRAR